MGHPGGPPPAAPAVTGKARTRVDTQIAESALAAKVQPILAARLASVTRRIANQARADVPVKTGNLGRSIREDEIRFIGPFVAESGVTAHAPYSAAVHQGTRPHVIRPRRAEALRFEIGGRVVFSKLVHHPGVRGRPFLRNAAERILAAEK